jgi:Acetyltransferases, including N-acetylases of ribosomal proteins
MILQQVHTLQTDRLTLRAFRREDLADFYEYSKNPNVGPRAGWAPHTSLLEARQVLSSLRKRMAWAIVEKSTDRLIGTIDLHQDQIRPTIGVLALGYSLAESTWGRGYATEAARELVRHVFEDLQLPVLAANHYVTNPASGRVLQKCGFRLEGTLRQAGKLFDDSVYDRVCYSITREEYDQQQRENKKGSV